MQTGPTDKVLVKGLQLPYNFLRLLYERDRFFHILLYLYFTDENEPDMMDKNSDRLWKIRNLFEILKEKFSKFYNPSEHPAIDEVIVKYKGRVIF